MLYEDDSIQAETSLLLSEGEMKFGSPDGRGPRGLPTPTDPNTTFMEDIATSAHVDISNLADRSVGSAHTNLSPPRGRLDDDTALHADASQYQDFHTIDWQRDLSRDRLRHMYISKRRMRSIFGAVNSLFDAGSGWLCVLLVGLAAGSVAGVIDIGAKWMSDLKDGICIDQFWLDKEHCCWSDVNVSFAGDKCVSWIAWPELFGVFYGVNGSLYIFIDLLFYAGSAVAMSGLCVMLVKVFAPYACGSGIPEIKCILSGFIIRGYLGKWTFIVKSVGLMLAASSGLSLGKEGPMVHLACCIGNILSYLFPKYGKNEAKKREILSASAAAGVSVAFGAPIGGVMFSLEEASYYFPLKTLWRSFFCACVAGIILKMVNPFGSEQETLFQVDYKMKWAYAELIPFSLLGVLGGVIGAIFIKANIRWCKFRKSSRRLGSHPVFEVLIVTAFTALISYPNPYMRESMSSLIKKLFDRCGPEDITGLCDYTNRTFDSAKSDDVEMASIGAGVNTAIWQMSIACGCRLLLTVFTFGLKVPAGLFVPSMAVGSVIGRIFGIVLEQWAFNSKGDNLFWNSACGTGKQCITPGLYAMVGAAAVLGGVTRMTVSLVVIMFELTSNADFIVPTMAAVMFAKWVGDALGREGIYDAHIGLNEYPFLDNKEEYIVYTKASDVMAPRPGDPALRTVTAASMTVGDLEQLLAETNYNGFPVVDSHNDPQYLVGFVIRRDLELALSQLDEAARAQQEGIVTNSVVYFTEHKPNTPELVGQTPLALRGLMDQAPVTIPSHTAMETVIEMFRKLGLRQTLVIENGCLLGIITKKDVLMHIHHIGENI